MTTKSTSLLFPLLLVFYEITIYLSNDMYLPALPQMMKDLGLTTQHAQLTLTAWFVGSAVMPMMAGALTDRFGRRSVLLFGGIIYVCSGMVCALAHAAWILLIARAIQGAMVATMLVPGYAAIHELYDQKTAIRTLAIMGSISVLAPAFGPLLGGIVLYFSNWRIIFWFIAVSAFILILLLAKWMPETCPPAKRQAMHVKKLALQYWRIISNKQFMVLMMMLGCIFGGFLAWITAGPLLVMVSFHHTAIFYGVVQAAIFIVYILGSHCVKYFMEWLGIHRLITLGVIISLLGGLFIFIFAWMYPTVLFLFVIAMMLYALGSALCFSPLNRAIIETSDEPMGVRMAFFIVCLQGSAALGSGIASLFFSGSLLSLAWIITVASMLACLLMLTKNYLAK